jgi:hypothetical protein
VVAGVAVAQQLHSAALLGSARGAFVQGMDAMLWACGGIGLASAILALIFLPRRAGGTMGVVASDAMGAPGASAASAASAGDSERAGFGV